MSGKYSPLEKHLSAIPRDIYRISLAFTEIELIIADQLPLSAYKYSAWWSNEKKGHHVQKHSWFDAGWKVSHLDLSNENVTFQRK
jgi:hypothetical protein